VGLSTVIAIQGNKVFPGLGDWYLGKTGFKSQQTSEPADHDRPDNLWAPVDQERDYGAHGAFDDEARKKSWQLWANTHRGLVSLVASGVVGAIAASLLWRK
ncbi:MAG TPA: hypothetical protein VFU49_16305, partial [Ktedonobacteraceae bacterium]|nr:hypothetical protein [Ktedonobacteraceae bacterium]